LALGNNGPASLTVTAGAYNFPDTTRSFTVPAYPNRKNAPANKSGYLSSHPTPFSYNFRISE
jgi:hypothetical protein